MPVGSNFTIHPEIKQIMATYRRSKSGATPTEGPSNSASPASSIGLSNFSSVHGTNNNAPKYGTLIPNRIFVGGISANTTESELSQLFSKYGNVKASKIIADRAGVSKGYGFVTFDSEEEVRCLIQDCSNIVLKERRLNIAPAVKKQPSFSRSFEAASPPPATTNLYFHNGVPYTFHNGMAFFPPTAPQPALAALPPTTDQHMYPTYGPTQNTAPAPYGTPVLVPAPPPVFMPQNYSYQPLPMTNGASTQFIYTGPGSTNGGAGSPLAGTPDNPSMPTPLTPQYYTQPFAPQETFYHHATAAVYLYPYAGEYEAQEQQVIDGCSSAATTPHSDISDRSSNRSPGHLPVLPPNIQFMNNNKDVVSGPGTDAANGDQSANKPNQANTDNQVPVVSWQNLKNHAEERELYIRDGRRAFYPTGPPPPPRTTTQMVYCHQTQFQAFQTQIYPPPKQNQPENYYAPRQFRGRQRSSNSANNMPYIPKFPDSFNNNNPLTMNNNFHEKKPGDVSNGKSQKFVSNRRGGNNRGNCNGSPPPFKPNPYSSEPSPSPQVQHYERQHVAPRWNINPQAKRLVYNKRPNGSTSNMAVTTTNNIRLAKKHQVTVDGDLGGGGDTQPTVQLALTPPRSPPADVDEDNTSKMESLSLATSS